LVELDKDTVVAVALEKTVGIELDKVVGDRDKVVGVGSSDMILDFVVLDREDFEASELLKVQKEKLEILLGKC